MLGQPVCWPWWQGVAMSQRDNDTGQSLISGAWIRRLLDEHVLTSVWKRPSQKACDDLAGGVEFVRRAYKSEHDPVAAEFDKLAALTAGALDTLADTLPRQRTTVAKSGAPGPAAALDDLARAVAAVRGSYRWAVAYPALKPRTPGWHGVIVTLAEDFCGAMAGSNPGIKIGRARHGGVLAKYLVQIIPHVTGESPNPAAVMAELSRQAGKHIQVAEWLEQHPTCDSEG